MIVIAAIASGGTSSKSLPKGKWGKTIACLESDPLLLVTDANSASAANPDRNTTAVSINSQLHGYQLATIEDAESPARARSVVRMNGLLAPTANYETDGPIVWAWTEGGDTPHVLASASDQATITSCIVPTGS